MKTRSEEKRRKIRGDEERGEAKSEKRHMGKVRRRKKRWRKREGSKGR